MKFTPAHTVVAITGAGSGIGRALSVALAHQGCHLSLSDINQTSLDETHALCAADLATHHTRAYLEVLDVSQKDAVYEWAQHTQTQFGQVHAIINNAGVAMGCPIEDLDYTDFEWIMNINFWGMVYGSKAFLPLIKASGGGHIVNVSSIFGLTAQPTQAGYNASKFAIRGFTEALAQELVMEQCNVGVTCVHPGGIKTNIANAARLNPAVARLGVNPNNAQKQFNKLLFTPPETAAQQIIRAMRKNQRRLVIGMDGKAVDWMQRLLPSQYQRIIVAAARFQNKRRV